MIFGYSWIWHQQTLTIQLQETFKPDCQYKRCGPSFHPLIMSTHTTYSSRTYSFSTWVTPLTTWSHRCLSSSVSRSKGLAIRGQTQPYIATLGTCLFSSSIGLDPVQTTVTLYSKAQLVNTVNPTIRLLPLNQKMMQLNDAETWSAMNSLCQFKFVQKPNVFGTLTLYQQALCWIRYHLSFLQLA